MDVVLRRLIPWPSLFGIEDQGSREDDVVARRRASFWRRFYRLLVVVALVTALVVGTGLWKPLSAFLASGQLLQYAFIFPIFFLMNFLIFFGPMVAMGISQIQGFEPGDADWGVKLQDVRGQAEAKEEVRRIVTLWQSGEAFEQAGGKRERGILFLGAPGTGKTMLSKGIATAFNCPFVSIPGSGFAQTFIGMDIVIVRFLARKAKKLARKWGGQCIIFIDEIDAVGTRRSALGARRNPLLHGGRKRLLPRPLLLRPERRADADGRSDSRVARLA
ncbi:MAG: AAA family ATPase [Actinobacteria bacterium]|nr:AAA family ATPase [Actinomycetota bacterium]